MRELSIERDIFPHMKPYIRAYPHLTRLHVKTDHADDLRCDSDHPIDTVQELRAHRALNIAEQSGQSWVWNELGEFTGFVTDLFLIGLTCVVNRVRLYETDWREVNFDMFKEVLAMARPKELKVDGYSGLLLHPVHGLIPVLKSPNTRMEYLAAEVWLGEDDRETDIAEALEQLFTALTTRPFHRLRLFLRVHKLDPTPDGPSLIAMIAAQRRGEPSPETPPPMPLTRAELSLQSFDLAAFTRRLGEAIPSLTDALIAISGLRGREERLVASIPAGANSDIDICNRELWEL
ncbi:hypothetical protein C8Q80DRAFT_1267029 [Daedaleopsis nitida]|nr:hypothetical protein C8Q80DRAFT_1267029 [Daedaleopsis nitida]